MDRVSALKALACGAALATAGTAQAGGWSFGIGLGIGWGSGCGGGWFGPYIAIGSGWYGGYSRCYDDWYGPCGWNPSYCGPSAPYPSAYPCTPSYSYSAARPPAASEAVRIAQTTARPVAPAAPTETYANRGWRLLESGEPGAMEAFGKAIARRESADAYLGYAICAARAGQGGRAEWAAKTAVAKDADVLAKSPAGDGVKAAAAAALARYECTPESAARGATLALLSGAAGVAPADDAAGRRLAGAEAAPVLRDLSAGDEPLVRPASVVVPVQAGNMTKAKAAATDTRKERRVVVDVKPDAK